MTTYDINNIKLIAEAAAEWMIVLEDSDSSEELRKEFTEWLRMSPLHIKEFLYLSDVFYEIKNNNNLPSVEEIVNMQCTKSNIVDISSHVTKQEHSVRKPIKKYNKAVIKLTSMAAMIALMVVMFVVFNPFDPNGNDLYVTNIGEQRSILLEDGTVVSLNTKTKIQLKFTEKLRLVELIEGEAIFNVTKNPNRPFRVESGLATVEVVGTTFNMHRKSSGTVITVVEGVVNVSGKTDNGNDLINVADKPLTKGDQVLVKKSGEVKNLNKADLNSVTAWTSRKMIFKGETLQSVIYEINRYSHSKVIIKSSLLNNKKIHGVFSANDPKVLLEFLSKVGGINIQKNKEGETLLFYSNENLKKALIPII